MDVEEVFKQYPLKSGIVYYPGSGTDWGPIELFGRHSLCETIIYSDYGLNRLYVRSFVKNIPGWSVEDKIENILPKDLGIDSWAQCWPEGMEEINRSELHKLYFVPERAFGYKALLTSGSRRIQFYFLATESIQTYAVLMRAKLKPSAIVLQDHGLGCNWASFGGDSPIYRLALELEHLPRLLLVADNTKVWDGYEQISDYEESRGQMHNHQRALFAIGH